MTFPNRFPIKCATCKEIVQTGQGWTSGPPWVTKCQPCSGVVARKPVVQVRMQGRSVTFRPLTFLGGALFDQYRAATTGTFFDGKTRMNCTDKVDVAVQVIQNLKTLDVLVDLDQSVIEGLRRVSEAVVASVQSATARADQLDARLKERGLGLYGFQRVGVRWLASRTNCLLNDPMGVGKTIQALTALPENAAVLVVGPAVAKGVWAREVAKWRPDLTCRILSGRGNFAWPKPGEVILVNYDILPDEVATPPLGVVGVCDEAHVLKNYKTQRSRRCANINQKVRANSGRTWLLTATPMLNRPVELWSLLQQAGLAGESFGSWSRFVEAFNGYKDKWGGYVWGTPGPDAATLYAKVSLRREKSTVLPDMPAKTIENVDVDLAGQDLKAIDAIIESVGGVEAVEAAIQASLTRRHEAVDFQKISAARALLAKAKIPALLEMVESAEEQEEPLVVFSAHRAPVDMLGTRPGWAVITGDTSAEDRTAIENDFQAGKLLGVACTIKAGGVAITLTRAHMAVFVDREWTPALNEQAEDRIHRIGQQDGVLIRYLVGDHWLDQRIAQLLAVKNHLIVNSVTKSSRDAAFDVAPVITDLAALDIVDTTAQLRAEATRIATAKVEAERIAAERAAEAEVAAKKERERAEADKKARRQAVSAETSRKNAVRRGYVVAADDPGRREAATADEFWAITAIQQLSADDPDRAQAENGVGFSKSDVSAGHWLSQELRSDRGLTDNQWRLLVQLAGRYPRQVGYAPSRRLFRSA